MVRRLLRVMTGWAAGTSRHVSASVRTSSEGLGVSGENTPQQESLPANGFGGHLHSVES